MLSSYPYDKVYTGMVGIPPVEIYFNERLYNLFVGLPYTYMTTHGDLNYKLKVVSSRSGLFQKSITDTVETIIEGVNQSANIQNKNCDGSTRNI